MRAIEHYLIPLGATLPRSDRAVVGGYFIWLSLPEPLQAQEVAVRAKRDENLILAPGPIFAVRGDDNTVVALEGQVRLCFAWEEEGNLGKGIERLAKVIEAMKTP